MVGLALWHFAVLVPERFWSGIVGAFLAALLGALASGYALPAPGRSSGQCEQRDHDCDHGIPRDDARDHNGNVPHPMRRARVVVAATRRPARGHGNGVRPADRARALRLAARACGTMRRLPRAQVARPSTTAATTRLARAPSGPQAESNPPENSHGARPNPACRRTGFTGGEWTVGSPTSRSPAGRLPGTTPRPSPRR